MTTKIKFGFQEQSGAVVCNCQIESDELTDDEIVQRTSDLLNKGMSISVQKTMAKKR